MDAHLTGTRRDAGPLLDREILDRAEAAALKDFHRFRPRRRLTGFGAGIEPVAVLQPESQVVRIG